MNMKIHTFAAIWQVLGIIKYMHREHEKGDISHVAILLCTAFLSFCIVEIIKEIKKL